MYRTFDLPEDKVIWDVGHQSYTHKILSGRMAEFDELRQSEELSGFPKRKESPYDWLTPVAHLHLRGSGHRPWAGYPGTGLRGGLRHWRRGP